MFLSALANFSTMHAGTPIALSQLTLAVVLVAFGVAIMGMGFGRLVKTKESLKQHRWTLTTALILTLTTVFLVMSPSFVIYYIDPDVQALSTLSITTLAHAGLAVPAIISALIYAFGDLPANVRKWMRITAVFWTATLIAGVVLFLQMTSII